MSPRYRGLVVYSFEHIRGRGLTMTNKLKVVRSRGAVRHGAERRGGVGEGARRQVECAILIEIMVLAAECGLIVLGDNVLVARRRTWRRRQVVDRGNNI